MRVAIAVAAKELRQRLRDRSAIFIAFVAPTLLAAIVTGGIGGNFSASGNRIHFNVALADADNSSISKAFGDVVTSKQLSSLLTVKKATPDEARRLVKNLDAGAAFIVPKGFQAFVTGGGPIDITVLARADNTIVRDISVAIATAFTEQITASRLSVFTAVRATGKLNEIATLAAQAARERMPVQVGDVPLATRPVSGANYFGPGMAMFFLFFTVGAGARSLFAEKETGTLQRILAAPAGRGAVVAGKALAMMVLGLLSMSSVFLTMKFLFGVHWGDPLAIAALTLLIVFALLSVSALVQTLAKTEQQAASYGSVIGMVFALAGGSFFPLFQMPKFVQKISALTPNGWALRGFTDIAYDGAKAAQLVPNFLAIGAFCVVCGTIAYINARRISVR